MATVELRDIVDALYSQSDEAAVWLNPATGGIVRISGDELRLAEEEGGGEWRQEILPFVREAIAGKYLRLPDRFEIHEWSIMERFAEEHPDPKVRDELLDAVHGPGAFRFFRAATHQLGIEEDWYRFRESAFEEIAREWLEANGIEYEQEQMQRGWI